MCTGPAPVPAPLTSRRFGRRGPDLGLHVCRMGLCSPASCGSGSSLPAAQQLRNAHCCASLLNPVLRDQNRPYRPYGMEVRVTVWYVSLQEHLQPCIFAVNTIVYLVSLQSGPCQPGALTLFKRMLGSWLTCQSPALTYLHGRIRSLLVSCCGCVLAEDQEFKSSCSMTLTCVMALFVLTSTP